MGTYRAKLWAADHDLWSPNYISRSLWWLNEYPGRVLAFPDTTLIDADGQEVGPMPATPADLADNDALTRYRRLIWRMHNGNMIYGLIVRDALERTSLGQPMIGPDHLILAELALQGPFQRAYGARFYRREWRDVATEQDRRTEALGIASPDYRVLRDAHLRAVRRSSLGLLEKAAAYLDTRRCFRARF